MQGETMKIKKSTKKRIVIIAVTLALYIVYLISDIPQTDIIPTALLILMFLGLALVRNKQL